MSSNNLVTSTGRREVVATVRPKKATLTDVARRAGVSVTTASYILNGRSSQMRIAPDTAQRVQLAMLELRYRPNWSARRLRGSSTQTIGVISDFLASGGFASRLLIGVNAAARRCDHVVIIGETMGNPDMERLLVEEMLDRDVDGLLYATVSASHVTLPERLRQERTVLLNCVDPRLELPAVLPDDRVGGRLAAEHLIEHGVAREVYVVGETPAAEASAGPERLQGIERALAAAGATLAGMIDCAWDVEPAYSAVAEFLRSGGRPRSLICLNDRVAMGTYQALSEHGMRVPENVAVISFDGSDLARWLRPRLASLALPFTEMGNRAVEVLMDPDWRSAGVVRMPPVILPGASV